jgi:hypothetical protein
MLAAARKSGESLKGEIRAQDDQAVRTMAEGQKGKRSSRVEITTLDPAALAEWRQATEGIYPKMKDKMVPPDLFDEVQRLRDDFRAQHPAKSQAKADAQSDPKSDSKGTGAAKDKVKVKVKGKAK